MRKVKITRRFLAPEARAARGESRGSRLMLASIYTPPDWQAPREKAPQVEAMKVGMLRVPFRRRPLCSRARRMIRLRHEDQAASCEMLDGRSAIPVRARSISRLLSLLNRTDEGFCGQGKASGVTIMTSTEGATAGAVRMDFMHRLCETAPHCEKREVEDNPLLLHRICLGTQKAESFLTAWIRHECGLRDFDCAVLA